ncbi:redoxin domain-containing protein [Gracilibacillus sp. S3-1-1]|uniref:Redoxin domain-containing protein n=1 Tax=Gracilibacillus pellucidus TaxID=3095368 RepID=A0ACC6M2J2_9BACI|nr:redoxin domain-containing protein [Gracilibacillus sp. S3-1-1]MDX8045095.1 redoxin domain-containing protein [Gracilibacillus sp. S3-1-1]
MKKWIICIFLLGMVVWVIVDGIVTERDDNVGVEIGDMAPDFALETVDGRTVRLSDFHGEPVMLNFWATWCPPCVSEMPDIERLQQDTNLNVLAINLTETESNLEDVSRFIEEHHLTMTIPLDKENKVADQYKILPIPTTYMIDSQGIIQFFVFGPLTYEQMMMEYSKLD